MYIQYSSCSWRLFFAEYRAYYLVANFNILVLAKNECRLELSLCVKVSQCHTRLLLYTFVISVSGSVLCSRLVFVHMFTLVLLLITRSFLLFFLSSLYFLRNSPITFGY
jgi:hypothetical protein